MPALHHLAATGGTPWQSYVLIRERRRVECTSAAGLDQRFESRASGSSILCVCTDDCPSSQALQETRCSSMKMETPPVATRFTNTRSGTEQQSTK